MKLFAVGLLGDYYMSQSGASHEMLLDQEHLSFL